ncbi:MAG: valine--tRNA ligase [Elusimicrobiota bacterium]
MKNIPKRYNPKNYENKWAEFWVEEKTFHSQPASQDESFSIVIPPPNVTGELHMGHALNNVLQDIAIRVNKIQGVNVLWIPGTDHGGIATQNVVERKLLAEGKTRHDLGREKFLKRMWEWKEESGGNIIGQLKRLGCGCDWTRQRFTMDEQCSKAVKEAFVRLYEKGLIYRGEYMVNRCPRCNTALSDIEVEHMEKTGNLWHIKYPIKNAEDSYITVATTRPETMLGDTAVAVNPDDERYTDLVGKKVILPLVGRELKIIADDFVDSDFGTGMVKVTPAHDPNDFDMGQRHDLDVIKIIDNEGKMTDRAGEFRGMDRFECRKVLVRKLKKEGYIKKIEDYQHSVGECYRCDTVIEPLLSKQWFVKVDGLSEKALDASRKEKIDFIPPRWENPYINWLENLHDWCISRQIWWGHRIPVYYCRDNDDCPPIAAKEKPEECPNCGGTDIVQDKDVLDTWFSSALWPFSTLGWPEKTEEMDYYYPTQLLVTGNEILYLWVARMVMMGLEMVDDIPFEKVNIHGMIRDKNGEKMSKSKGNVIDPLNIIDEYGTDALRFALAKSAVPGRDMQIDNNDFISARNFCNKLWNASRLILDNLTIRNIQLPRTEDMELADIWILGELKNFTKKIKEGYRELNNARTARYLYDFIWKNFCDWYLELAKLRLYSKDQKERENVQQVLAYVLQHILCISHPVMPFITSELWTYLSEELNIPKNPLDFNGFEQSEITVVDSEISRMNKIMDIIDGIRNIRGELRIDPSDKMNARLKAAGEDKELLQKYGDYIKTLAGLKKLSISPEARKNPGDGVAVSGEVSIYVSLSKELKEREIKRLKKQIAGAREQIEYSNKKLDNEDFVKKAPDEVVNKVRKKVEKYKDRLQKLEKNLKELV